MMRAKIGPEPAFTPVAPPNDLPKSPAEPWERDAALDSQRRQTWIVGLLGAEQRYDAVEEALIQRAVALRDACAAVAMPSRLLKHSPTIERMSTKLEASGRVLGEAEAVIPAAVLELVAFLMHYDSKFWQSLVDPRLDVRSEIVDVVSSHHAVMLNVRQVPPFAPRAFLNSIICKKVSDEPLEYVVAVVPTEARTGIKEVDEKRDVRAEFTKAFFLTALGPRRTRLAYACSLRLNGRFPQWLVGTLAIPQLMQEMYSANVLPAHT